MNAHHKKASYRPPPPKSLSRYAAGTSELAVVEGAGGAGGQQGLRRLAETAQRLPFGWQVRRSILAEFLRVACG